MEGDGDTEKTVKKLIDSSSKMTTWNNTISELLYCAFHASIS